MRIVADGTAHPNRQTTQLELRRLFNLSSQVFVALQPANHLLLFLAFLAAAPLAFCQQGTVIGTVVDTSGATIAHSQVRLSLDNGGPHQTTQSGHDGDFSFPSVASGAFHLSFAAEGFAPNTIAGELRNGETLNLPHTALAVATTTEVNVTQTQAEIAEAQIKIAADNLRDLSGGDCHPSRQ